VGFALAVLWRFPGDLAMGAMAGLMSGDLDAVSIIDIRRRVIPDTLTLSMLLGGILFSPFNSLLAELPGDRIIQAFCGILPAAALLGLAAFLGWVRRRPLLGGGDVKLMAALGSLLGWEGSFAVLFIASALSLLGPVFTAGPSRGSLHRPIPFGPFLSAASFLVLFVPSLMRSVLLVFR